MEVEKGRILSSCTSHWLYPLLDPELAVVLAQRRSKVAPLGPASREEGGATIPPRPASALRNTARPVPLQPSGQGPAQGPA